jgi:hypothetical protein
VDVTVIVEAAVTPAGQQCQTSRRAVRRTGRTLAPVGLATVFSPRFKERCATGLAGSRRLAGNPAFLARPESSGATR